MSLLLGKQNGSRGAAIALPQQTNDR